MNTMSIIIYVTYEYATFQKEKEDPKFKKKALILYIVHVNLTNIVNEEIEEQHPMEALVTLKCFFFIK